MAGELGTPSKPLDFEGEQWVLEPRTSDPASTEEGDAWLRTDLAPEANQLATLRFDNGSGTWDVPVFQTGTSGADVEEVLRIRVGGTTGYIPIAETGAFSALGFQHAGTRHALHNAVELSAIPDSGLQHNYDAQALSGFSDTDPVSTFDDQQGSNDATGSGAYQDSQINGNPTVLCDGSSDGFAASVMPRGTNDVYTIAGVAQFVSFSADRETVVGNDEVLFNVPDSGDNFELNHIGTSSSPTGGNPDLTAFRYVGAYDGTNLILEIDGTAIFNVSHGIGDNVTEGIGLGARDSGDFPQRANIHLGQHLFYDEFYDASGRDDIDSALASRWGF